MPRKLGHLRPFRSKLYVFTGKDPILAKVSAVIEGSGLSKSAIQKRAKGGVSASTLYNWRPKGRTRRPQFCTIEATLRACGKTLVMADLQ